MNLTEEVEFGPDDETVATVSKILIEELVGVTDRLDLYVRSTSREVAELVELFRQWSRLPALFVVGKNQHQQTYCVR